MGIIRTVFLLFLFGSCYYNLNGQYNIRSASIKKVDDGITVVLKLHKANYRDSGQFTYLPVDYIDKSEWQIEWKKPENGIVSLKVNSKEPVYLYLNDLLVDRKFSHWLAEPGDKVIISSMGNGLHFSGEGAERYYLQYQLDSLNVHFPKPANRYDINTKSIADYFEWQDYLDKKITLAASYINSYKNAVSTYSLALIKDAFINNAISQLNTKFSSLWSYLKEKNQSLEELKAIYDTAFSITAEKWSAYLSNKELLHLNLSGLKTSREFGFDDKLVPSKAQMNLAYYRQAISIYKGAARERFIINTIPKQLMTEVGFTPEVESLLQQYYAEPQFREYKKWMKEQELKIRIRKMVANPPDFIVTDAKGQQLSKEGLKQKMAILYFTVSGSEDSEKLALSFKKLQHEFRNEKNVVFVNISADKDFQQWRSGLEKEINNTGNVIYAYTQGAGINHSMIKQYVVNSFPAVRILHPEGRIIMINEDPARNNGKEIAEIIQKHLAIKKDGPYVFAGHPSLSVWYIENSKPVNTSYKERKANRLLVQTDLNKPFEVTLKKSLAPEPSIYPVAEKLLVLSDIEGNFDMLRKLLQRNQVIDENFNWTFGKGHLVFAGDMFDRGLQVTECLWLLYSLEEKARADGGYLHFILGNHEIMNMRGDHRYVQQKYKDNAALIGKSLTELYSENSEIGGWLRTKNIMEKIGHLLFVHGGISHEVWRMPLNIEEINNLARPYYARPIDSTNQHLLSLFGNRRVGAEKSYPSPFWFRGYYGDSDNPLEIPTMKQMDSTLTKFNVDRVITGHTIVGDTISVHYAGKVINTDTRHAEGKSEALLIEGNNYYRVNLEGYRKQLSIPVIAVK